MSASGCGRGRRGDRGEIDVQMLAPGGRRSAESRRNYNCNGCGATGHSYEACRFQQNSERSINSIDELPMTKEVGDVRSEQVASRDEPGGLVGSEVELVPEVSASKNLSDSPGSPVFEDALPNVTPPLQGRPIRQCRLRKLIKHYD
ncbi:unnamed protein product, partial [Iphiclides podalirius]